MKLHLSFHPSSSHLPSTYKGDASINGVDSCGGSLNDSSGVNHSSGGVENNSGGVDNSSGGVDNSSKRMNDNNYE
ncbi:conserved hypothetical protein [Ricinus communis]|uniref:Uncharacterized protein n=1 Tax=Ricinus communis TaxID=3988 RepID=B9SWM0_RICCO|nr:conserved hypothetical protein [Ricinus communis]